MAVLTAAKRKAIPKSDFAIPSKAPASGSYPIPDVAHARNALVRSSGKAAAAAVRAKVHAKFPGIGKPKGKKSKFRRLARKVLGYSKPATPEMGMGDSDKDMM